ncbi:MAG: hypothetical protein JSS07_11370 [Proteobacteria bacterium]|nr:hypothetical protein [Pseudomonadota bacterium]
MNMLNQTLSSIAGGNSAVNMVQALSMAIQIYENTSGILTQAQPSIWHSTSCYAKLGRELSEKIFDVTHPNLLGQMIYYSPDIE